MRSRSYTILCPDAWRRRRVYFAVNGRGIPVIETVRLSRAAARRAAEGTTGMRWRDLEQLRWDVASVG